MNPLQIIIPVYRDRKALEQLLPELLRQGWSAAQITVVDASEENQVAVDNPWGVQLLRVGADLRGRARQMNHGAARSRSDALLFLHADTSLPPDAQSRILECLAAGNIGGAFSRRFDSPSRFLRCTCVLADLRTHCFGWAFGDQAIFCTREAFDAVDGFPDIAPFEDLEFSRRLKTLGPFTLLRPGVISSARRFEAEGPWRRTRKDLRLTLRYFFQKKGG